MLPGTLLCLQLLLALTAASEVFVIADTNNETAAIANAAKEIFVEANHFALNDTDVEQDSVVRKKRTFGDIVFRGLADVLGYNIARKPPGQIPPPLDPVPGIDIPLQAAPAPAPVPPCGTPRAVPPPCRTQAPPLPPPPPPKPIPPPCPKPRVAPRPKPRPPPPPPPPQPPPPPCAKPRANPTTPSPCAPPPPPAQPKSDNLQTITSNFRLNFDFNRVTAAPQTPAAAETLVDEEPQYQDQIYPVAIEPRAGKVPPAQVREPRVYVDAYVLRNGVAEKVHAVDAQNLNEQQSVDDYLIYDDEPQAQGDDDYEDVQESRDRGKGLREFGTVVDHFWDQKKDGLKMKPKERIPANDYRNVHFGDRDLANQIRLQNNQNEESNKQRPPTRPNDIPEAEEDDEPEITTTTQDPRRRLKPRILPPTEQNPNEIDTVTVRVPPIYNDKHPKKLHRKRPDRPDRDEHYYSVPVPREFQDDSGSDRENSAVISQTEPPKRKRLKQSRKSRSAKKFSANDYNYFGKKLSLSKEHLYKTLTIPPPTKDADVDAADDYFLDDHERLSEDPEKILEEDPRAADDDKSYHNGRTDESERVDENERLNEDYERTGESERADEDERTDKLSPNARVRESGYQNNFVRATNVQVDDLRPVTASVKKKSTKIG